MFSERVLWRTRTPECAKWISFGACRVVCIVGASICGLMCRIVSRFATFCRRGGLPIGARLLVSTEYIGGGVCFGKRDGCKVFSNRTNSGDVDCITYPVAAAAQLVGSLAAVFAPYS